MRPAGAMQVESAAARIKRAMRKTHTARVPCHGLVELKESER